VSSSEGPSPPTNLLSNFSWPYRYIYIYIYIEIGDMYAHISEAFVCVRPSTWALPMPWADSVPYGRVPVLSLSGMCCVLSKTLNIKPPRVHILCVWSYLVPLTSSRVCSNVMPRTTTLNMYDDGPTGPNGPNGLSGPMGQMGPMVPMGPIAQ
jgi:hypothetical protein